MKINPFIYLFFIFIIFILNTQSVYSSDIISLEKMYSLPNGRNTGSILENWFPGVIFFPVETGGLSRIDLPRFSDNGISWVEQNFRINGIDITDPYISGCPLFEPAWESITVIELKSRQENDPYSIGLDWKTEPSQDTFSSRLSYNNIFPTSNASFIPEGLLDREPSFTFGSPSERRKYIISNEINASYYNTDKFYLGAESLFTKREFPNLLDNAANKLYENAEKYSLSSIYKNENSVMPYRLIFISQYNHNDNYGANSRLDYNKTVTQENLAGHFSCISEKKISLGEINILSGLTARSEKLSPHLLSPLITEFADDSGPVPDKGIIKRINYDNKVIYKNNLVNIEAAFQINALSVKPDIPYLQTKESYNSGIYAVTVWDTPSAFNEYSYNARLKSELFKTWGAFTLSGNIYLDDVCARANSEELFNWYGIGCNLSSKYEIKKINASFFIGGLHQPSKINSETIGFLDSNRPSGKRYSNWTDINDNNIADGSELSAAALISSTGGKYHHKAANLSRPYQDEFSIGIEKAIGNSASLNICGAHRIFSNYFIVNYANYNGNYTTAPDGTSIYNKPPGIDEYYLSNRKGETAHYSGADIGFKIEHEKFFLNLSFTAYLVKGYAPIGNGFQYNDYAIISEESASPNSRINSSGGRLASDRAYIGKVLFAYNFKKNLSAGVTLKYRDGEPFTQYRIYYDSNGIPVRVMNQKRGDWYGKGIGRYTFAWNMDLRLFYKLEFLDTETSVSLDVYNVLGSATEILESPNPSDKRSSLEAVPQRMIRFGVDVKF